MSVPFKVDLSGEVAVVTGAGGVLCSGFAKALAECGAKVAVCDLRADAAQKVADEITAAGGTAAAFEMNVLQKDSIIAAQAAIHEKFGAVTLLLNGAGGNNPKGTTDREYCTPEDIAELEKNGTIEGVKTFFDLDPAGVRFVFDLNVIAALLTTQVFAKDMIGRGGNILNVSSMNAFRPLTRIPAYSGAKAAVSNFTQWLAVHFAPVGIRVNAIAPGFFLTEQNRTLLTNPDGSLTARADKIITHTPMNRFGVPADLDGVLLWLADDRFSAFVDGVVVPVDGGFAAYSGV